MNITNNDLLFLQTPKPELEVVQEELLSKKTDALVALLFSDIGKLPAYHFSLKIHRLLKDEDLKKVGSDVSTLRGKMLESWTRVFAQDHFDSYFQKNFGEKEEAFLKNCDKRAKDDYKAKKKKAMEEVIDCKVYFLNTAREIHGDIVELITAEDGEKLKGLIPGFAAQLKELPDEFIVPTSSFESLFSKEEIK